MSNNVPWLMPHNFRPEGVQKTVDRYMSDKPSTDGCPPCSYAYTALARCTSCRPVAVGRHHDAARALAVARRPLATVQQREREADEHAGCVAAFEASSGGVWRRVAPPDGSIGKIQPLFAPSHPLAGAHPLPPCARWGPRLGSARPPHAARLAQAGQPARLAAAAGPARLG